MNKVFEANLTICAKYFELICRNRFASLIFFFLGWISRNKNSFSNFDKLTEQYRTYASRVTASWFPYDLLSFSILIIVLNCCTGNVSFYLFVLSKCHWIIYFQGDLYIRRWSLQFIHFAKHFALLTMKNCLLQLITSFGINQARNPWL